MVEMEAEAAISLSEQIPTCGRCILLNFPDILQQDTVVTEAKIEAVAHKEMMSILMSPWERW